MSAWSASSAAPFDPDGNHGRERLLCLIGKIHDEVPGAGVSKVAAGWLGFYSVTVTFQNGLSLLVSTDTDLPEALFEVIRFVDSDCGQQHPFETRAALGFFGCDKLPSHSAIDLLNRYREVDALQQ